MVNSNSAEIIMPQTQDAEPTQFRWNYVKRLNDSTKRLKDVVSLNSLRSKKTDSQYLLSSRNRQISHRQVTSITNPYDNSKGDEKSYRVSKRPSGDLILLKSQYDNRNNISKERHLQIFNDKSKKSRHEMSKNYGDQVSKNLLNRLKMQRSNRNEQEFFNQDLQKR